MTAWTLAVGVACGLWLFALTALLVCVAAALIMGGGKR